MRSSSNTRGRVDAKLINYHLSSSLFYINDLLDSFVSFTLVSGYADDLALVFSDRNKEVAEMLESEAAKVYQWASDNHLTLNTAKSKVAFFSMGAAESSLRPKITEDSKRTAPLLFWGFDLIAV